MIWRRYRTSLPADLIDKCEMDIEKDAEKEKDSWSQKTAVGTPEVVNDSVTYFTFITDHYFTEASWPEILNAARRRREWSRKGPFQIERVVGERVERTYVREEIEAGEMESEETSWWARGENRKQAPNEKDQVETEKG